jgi:tetratricopeptide (TPR) repeat protein
MGRVIFFEPEARERPSAVCSAFLARFPEQASHVDRFHTIEDITAAALQTPIDAVVFNWTASKWPYLHLEEYWQHPTLATIPLVIVHDGLDTVNQAFIAEYGHESAIKSDSDLAKTAKQVHEAIAREHNMRLPSTRARIKARKFFQTLHAGNFDEAERYLDGHEDSFCTPAEKDFYRALVCKTKKDFDRAVVHLTQGLKAMKEQRILDEAKGQQTLAAKFLHLIGNIALKRRNFDQAMKFLSAASKISPRNLRRHFLLGQCSLEMGDKARALSHYAFIYNLCPVYPNIHVRMAELIYFKGEISGSIGAIEKLLPWISDRDLVGLYRRLPTTGDAKILRRILDMIIREFSVRANRLIDSDDFYAALKPYKYIEKIIEPSDNERQQSLSYCIARVYYRAGDLDEAAEHLQRSMSFSTDPSTKQLALKELIDKGLARKPSKSA